MKVYIFIIKHFYSVNGTDYAAAIDNEEISVHGSFRAANIQRMKSYDVRKQSHLGNILEEEFFPDDSARYWQMKLYSGWRYVFEIIEKDLC